MGSRCVQVTVGNLINNFNIPLSHLPYCVKGHVNKCKLVWKSKQRKAKVCCGSASTHLWDAGGFFTFHAVGDACFGFSFSWRPNRTFDLSLNPEDGIIVPQSRKDLKEKKIKNIPFLSVFFFFFMLNWRPRELQWFDEAHSACGGSNMPCQSKAHQPGALYRLSLMRMFWETILPSLHA